MDDFMCLASWSHWQTSLGKSTNGTLEKYKIIQKKGENNNLEQSKVGEAELISSEIILTCTLL